MGGKDRNPPQDLVDKIHAFMFVYDSSNKKTFDAMMCMVEVIQELERQKRKRDDVKKGGKKKSGGDKKDKEFYPRLIIVGNKKDLRKDRNAGVIREDDISNLEGIKIKEVSALTNMGIADVFKSLISDLNADPTLAKEAGKHYKKM